MRHISSRQEEEEVMSADVEGSISQSMAPVMRGLQGNCEYS